MSERPTIETLIVGGGPAGALCAALLAQAGRPVSLVERSAASQEKLCGDFLSGEAARPLARMGLDPLALGAVPVDRLRIVIDRRRCETRLPFPAYGISRRALDEAILERAAQSGAEILRGIAVRSLERRADVWRARLDEGEEISAARLLLATGKHDLRGHARAHDGGRAWLGMKMPFHLSAPERDALGAAIELYVFDGFYAGLQALPGRAANLCLAIPKALFQERGGAWDDVLSSLQHDAPTLRRRLSGASPGLAQPLAIAQIPYGYVAPIAATDGLIRLGDQAAVVPSFTGDGVAMALRSAEIAADLLIRHEDAEIAGAIARSHGPLVRRADHLARAALSAPGRALLAQLLPFAPSLAARLAAATRVMRIAA